MGRLSGFRHAAVAKKLRAAGFGFDRQAKGHRTTIPNHPGDIPEGTLRAIIRQTGLAVDEFLNL